MMSAPVGLAARDPGKKPRRAAPSRLRDAVSADVGFSVLIVDDSYDARYIYERYLTFCGARAFTAADGPSALAAARHDPPDIIVLDLALPGLTGWEVLRRLRADARTSDIPVLVLSGQSARESAIHAGADAYCDKPCPPSALLDEVRRLLARRREI